MKPIGVVSLIASLVLGTGALTVIHTKDIADSAVTDPKIAAGVAAAKIGAGTVDDTEFGYLNGVSSNLQTQLNAKGTASSVGLSMPAEFSVANSPVTGSATLAASWAVELQNKVLASPDGGSGTPSFRALAAADIPSLAASKITSGTIDTARLGSGTANSAKFLRGDQTWQNFTTGTVTSVAATVPTGLSVSGSPVTGSGTLAFTWGAVTGTSQFLANDPSVADNAPAFRSMVAADVPSLAASKITSGQLALAQGGTGVDLSATGGASFVLKQNASHVISAAQLAASDLSNGTTGSNEVVLKTSPTLVTPLLGTPTSGTLTNCTGLPIGSGVSGLATGMATFLGSGASADLAAALSDETGSGKAVFDTTPTLKTPILGVASATSINKVALTAPATGSTLTIADGKTLTASNTLTFTGTDSISVAFGGGGTVLYSGGALGTPSSGTLTNCTGLPIAGGGTGTTSGDATGMTTLVVAVSESSGTLLTGGTPTSSAYLTFNCTAGHFYLITGTLLIDADNSTNDSAFRLAAGAGTMQGDGQAQAPGTALTAQSVIITSNALTTSVVNVGAIGALGKPTSAYFHVGLVPSNTTTITLQFGQAANSGTTSKLYKGSWMSYVDCGT